MLALISRLLTWSLVVATAVAISFLESKIASIFQFDPEGFFVFFVIPMGAVYIGYAATIGFIFGAAMFRRYCDEIDRWFAICVALGSMLLTYYIPYKNLEQESQAFGMHETFLDFIDHSISEREQITFVSMEYKGAKFEGEFEGGEVGQNWGMVLFVLEAIGFAIGGAWVIESANKQTRLDDYWASWARSDRARSSR